LFGCATSKNKSWINPDFKDQTIGKTIVLATFEDKFLCAEYETTFARRLLDYVPAASMHADVKNVDTLDKKALENLLKENSVQTLIVTHVLNIANRSQLVPYGVSYVSYVGDYSSYYTECISIQPDESVDSFTEIYVETTVFDVNSGKLIWSGRKQVYDFNSDASNMEKVIDGVIWDLERYGMLKESL
jgi:calcineurin-like phosphoesterase